MILKEKKRFNLKKLDKKLRSKNAYKNFFLFVMGMLINAAAISVFYKPNDVVATGGTGLSIIISNYIDIDLSLIILVISSILLVIGFCVFGLEYGAKNILGTILFPVFIKATSLINRVVFFEDSSLFLLILIGSILVGIGFGLIRKSGYNGGGFNVLYDILNSSFKISIGKANLLCNMIIILFSLFTFGIDKCIYASIGLYISSVVADKIMLGISSNKAFYIVTKRPLAVRDYIINNLGMTTTIVNARGGYSDKKKKMLLCVLPTRVYPRVKEVIKEIDKDAFFLITDTYSISR